MKGLFVKKVTVYINNQRIAVHRYKLHYGEVPEPSEETYTFEEAKDRFFAGVEIDPKERFVRDIYFHKVKITPTTEVHISTDYISYDFNPIGDIIKELPAPEFIEYIKDSRILCSCGARHNHNDTHLEYSEGERKRKYFKGRPNRDNEN